MAKTLTIPGDVMATPIAGAVNRTAFLNFVRDILEHRPECSVGVVAIRRYDKIMTALEKRGTVSLEDDDVTLIKAAAESFDPGAATNRSYIPFHVAIDKL